MSDMQRRAIIAGASALLTTAALAQTHKRFMLPGPGNALLLEISNPQQPYSVIELENCTANVADNNCWILLETNTPGWTGHP